MGSCHHLMHRAGTVLALLAVFVTPAWGQYVWDHEGPGGGGATRDICFDPEDSNIVYMASDVGSFYRYDRRTGLWEQSNFGKTQQGTDGYKVHDIDVYWDPESRTKIIWLAASPGLYYSRNGGDSWARVDLTSASQVASLDPDKWPLASVAVDPKDPNVVYAGFGVKPKSSANDAPRGCGWILKVTFDGESWSAQPVFPDTAIDDETDVDDHDNLAVPAIRVDPLDSRIVYAIVYRHESERDPQPPFAHFGFVYSLDGGQRWAEMNRGLPARPGYSYTNRRVVDFDMTCVNGVRTFYLTLDTIAIPNYSDIENPEWSGGVWTITFDGRGWDFDGWREANGVGGLSPLPRFVYSNGMFRIYRYYRVLADQGQPGTVYVATVPLGRDSARWDSGTVLGPVQGVFRSLDNGGTWERIMVDKNASSSGPVPNVDLGWLQLGWYSPFSVCLAPDNQMYTSDFMRVLYCEDATAPMAQKGQPPPEHPLAWSPAYYAEGPGDTTRSIGYDPNRPTCMAEDTYRGLDRLWVGYIDIGLAYAVRDGDDLVFHSFKEPLQEAPWSAYGRPRNVWAVEVDAGDPDHSCYAGFADGNSGQFANRDGRYFGGVVRVRPDGFGGWSFDLADGSLNSWYNQPDQKLPEGEVHDIRLYRDAGGLHILAPVYGSGVYRGDYDAAVDEFHWTDITGNLRGMTANRKYGALAVNPDNPLEIYVGLRMTDAEERPGGIYRTLDGGVVWESVTGRPSSEFDPPVDLPQNIVRLVFVPAVGEVPDRVYAATLKKKSKGPDDDDGGSGIGALGAAYYPGGLWELRHSADGLAVSRVSELDAQYVFWVHADRDRLWAAVPDYVASLAADPDPGSLLPGVYRLTPGPSGWIVDDFTGDLNTHSTRCYLVEVGVGASFADDVFVGDLGAGVSWLRLEGDRRGVVGVQRLRPGPEGSTN
jgi:hypothetical protein